MTTAYRTTAIQPFGVSVEVDLQDRATWPAVADVFRTHGLVVVPNQSLTHDQQQDLLRSIGPVPQHPRSIGYVSNTREGGLLGNAEVSFHSDHAYLTKPTWAISLHAISVVDGATSTRIAGAARALTLLPADLRERLNDLSCLHLFAASVDALQSRQRLQGYPAGFPQATHPVVQTDPITGQDTLYITQLNAAAIVGLDLAESDALIEELESYIYSDDNIYEHKWNTGDFVIWSNFAYHHARPSLDPAGERTLQRVCITDATDEILNMVPKGGTLAVSGTMS